jgi:hypothetical protein
MFETLPLYIVLRTLLGYSTPPGRACTTQQQNQRKGQLAPLARNRKVEINWVKRRGAVNPLVGCANHCFEE